jgi:hypothetical protein
MVTQKKKKMNKNLCNLPFPLSLDLEQTVAYVTRLKYMYSQVTHLLHAQRRKQTSTEHSQHPGNDWPDDAMADRLMSESAQCLR